VHLFRIYINYIIKYPENNQAVAESKEVKMSSQTLEQIVKGRLSQPNQLIEVLQDIQKNYGYISKEAMQIVSQGLGVPLIEVYRVASFYKAFRLKPSGKNVLTMCTGTACHVRGARLLLDQATGQLGVKPGEMTTDGLFTIEHVNCMGACTLGPIVKENGSYHNHMSPAKLRKLIETLRHQKTEDNQNVQAQ
jgi:NADH-quinone oxidoreductase subunit E